jgi:hypothetical protein
VARERAQVQPLRLSRCVTRLEAREAEQAGFEVLQPARLGRRPVEQALLVGGLRMGLGQLQVRL